MLRQFIFYITLYYYLLFVLFSTNAESPSSQEVPSNGFLKREFSLSKPYSGIKMIVLLKIIVKVFCFIKALFNNFFIGIVQ